MFAGKTLINKICKIHHRTLQVMSVHQRHLRYLAIDVFKSIMHLNPQFMWSYIKEKPMPYNLRDGSKLVLPKTKSSHFVSLKNCQSLNEFKLELKNQGNIHCTCLVCL